MIAAVYVGAIVAANASVAYFGPASAPVNAFLLIGLDLTLRDRLHDGWTSYLWPRMLALVGAAGLLSWLVNPAAEQIALGSFVAFVAASTGDALTYHALRSRRWFIRANGSNLAGAAVDSVVFPAIAFGGFDWQIIAAMLAAKVVGGAFWSLVTAPQTRRSDV